jgi:hypothetical protein
MFAIGENSVPLMDQDKWVVAHILKDLNLEDLHLFSQVCQDWNQLLATQLHNGGPRIWEHLVRGQFPSLSPGTLSSFQKLRQLNSNLSRGIFSLKPFTDVSKAIVITKDGQLFSCCNRHIEKMDLKSKACTVFKEHKGELYSLVVDERGRPFSFDGMKFQIWDPESLTCVGVFPEEEHANYAFPNGTALNGAMAVGNGHFFYSDIHSDTKKSLINVIDYTSNSSFACIAILKQHDASISSMVVDRDTLISGSADRTIKLSKWCPERKTYLCIRTIFQNLDYNDNILDMLVQDRKLFASFSGGASVRVLDLENNNTVTTALKDGLLFKASAATWMDDGLKLVAEGDYLVSSYGSNIKIWNWRKENDTGYGGRITLFDDDLNNDLRITSLAMNNGRLYVASQRRYHGEYGPATRATLEFEKKVTVLDFTASPREILEELANHLASKEDQEGVTADRVLELDDNDPYKDQYDVDDNDIDVEQFIRIPYKIQKQVFERLGEILRRDRHGYHGNPADAFRGAKGENATFSQRSEAIFAYLETAPNFS